MYVVTTLPSFKKKFTEGNARKFTVNLAFCTHVDVIKIEKHLCFSLGVRRLLALSSSAYKI